MYVFHTNIINFTAVNFGTCYMFSKQITEDGLEKEQGMLERKTDSCSFYIYIVCIGWINHQEPMLQIWSYILWNRSHSNLKYC